MVGNNQSLLFIKPSISIGAMDAKRLLNEEIAELGRHPVQITSQGFDVLGLADDILKSVARVGFVHPTRIQSAVIPPALEGRDIIGLAETGSGKTAAFAIPIAMRLKHGMGIRGLVICPTREIALQTKAFLDLFGRTHGLNTVCIIGGVKMGPQIQALKHGADIIVATPGRLLDHLERKNVRLDSVEELILDEADHMFDMGFMPQLKKILKSVPERRHTMMFSATMPPEIERLAKCYLNEPVRIDVLPEGRAAKGITHRLYMVDEMDKKRCLIALLNQELGSTLVFTRMKRDADWVTRILEKEGHLVSSIHSDRTQRERVAALDGFRKGQHRILVATDIASRGIDVPGIEHIINFSVPETVEEYIHRAGRTARMDATGLVSTIATWQDKDMIRQIEKAIKTELPRCTVAGVAPYVEMKVKFFGRKNRRRR